MPLRRLRYQDVVLADNPGFYVILDKRTGGLWADISGHGNNFTPASIQGVDEGVTSICGGQPEGACYRFDGVDDNATGFDVDFVNAVCLEAWIAPSNIGATRPILIKHTAAPVPGSLQVVANAVQYACSFNGVLHILTSGAILANAIHYLVMECDGSSFDCYLDGILVASEATTPGVVGTNNTPWRIGTDPSAASFYAGKMQNLAGYDHKLGKDKIGYHWLVGSKLARRAGPQDEESVASQVYALGLEMDAVLEQEALALDAQHKLEARGIKSVSAPQGSTASGLPSTAYREQLAREQFGVDSWADVTQEMIDAHAQEERDSSVDNADEFGGVGNQDEIDAKRFGTDWRDNEPEAEEGDYSE